MKLNYILLVFIMLASLSSAYTKDQYLTFDYSEVDFGHACSYYTVCNPEPGVSSTLPDRQLGVDSFTELRGTVDKSTDGWQKQVTISDEYVYWVNDKCTPALSPNMSSYDNCTGHYETDTVYSREWRDIDESSFQLMPSECRQIRYCADFDMQLIRGQGWFVEIDHIPEYQGYVYPEYAWWNSTWGYGITINITNPYPANFTHNITITKDMEVYNHSMSDLRDIRFVEGNCSNAGGNPALGQWNWTVDTSGDSKLAFKTNTANVTQVCMLYNNSAAPNVFNGTDAYLYFSYGTGGWVSNTVACAVGFTFQWNSSEQALEIYGGAGVCDAMAHYNTTGWDDVMIETDYKVDTTGTNSYSGLIGKVSATAPTANYYRTVIGPNAGLDFDMYKIVAGVPTHLGGGVASITANLYTEYYFIVNDSRQNMTWNVTTSLQTGDTALAAYDRVGVRLSQDNVVHSYYRYFRTRYQVDVWPTYVFGPEESGNTAPVISYINLTPVTAYTTNDLTCNATVEDADNDTMNVTVRWYLNGVINGSLNESFLNVANGTTVNATLASANTTQVENWSCSAQAYDGTDYSSLNFSSNVTILNRVPQISGLALTPTSPTNSSDLTCAFTAIDMDGDSMNATFYWYKNGTINGTLNYTQSAIVNNSAVSRVLNSANTSVGDNWSCEVNLTDGYNITNDMSSNVTIVADGQVYISNVTIPTAIYPNGGIFCGAVANATTPTAIIEYQWYINGTLQNKNCYQETADEGNLSCRTTGQGNYSFTGSWSIGSDPDTYDGDWGTFAQGSSSPTIVYMDYWKPIYAFDANWTVKDQWGTEVIPVPNDCMIFDDAFLKFKVEAHNIGNSVTWFCQKEGGWETLRTNAGAAEKVYEEGVTWIWENDTVNGSNNTIIYSHASNRFMDMAAGDNITCSARAYANGSWSSWSNSSTVTVGTDTVNVTAAIYAGLSQALVGDTLLYYANVSQSGNGTITAVYAYSYPWYENETWGEEVDYALNDNMSIWVAGQYYEYIDPGVDETNNTVKKYFISMYARVNYTHTDNTTEIFESNETIELDYFNWFLCGENPAGSVYCGNCTDLSCMTLAFNISLIDEKTGAVVNGTTGATFNSTRGFAERVYSDGLNGTSFAYYIWPSWANFTTDSFEQYDASGYSTRFRFYNDATVDNVSNSITVYMLNSSLTSIVTIFVQDQYGADVPWVFVNCMKYFPATNSYSSVAMTRTDADGEGTVNLEAYGTWWKFAVYNDDGSLVYITPDPMQITCDPYCHVTITTGTGNITTYNFYDGISYNCTYVNSTTVLTCNYVVTSGAWKDVELIVRMMGRYAPICDVTSNASAGSVGCNLSAHVATVDDHIFSWKFIGHDPPPDFWVILDQGEIDYFGDAQYGDVGILIAFVMFAIVIFAFVALNPAAGLVAGIIVLIVLYLLNIIDIGIETIGGLSVGVIILAWLMSKRR